MDLAQFFADNPDWRPYADLVAMPPLPEEMMKEFSDISSEVLARCMEFVSEGGGHVTRGAIYLRVRREDRKDKYRHEADKWATMLALNCPPRLKSNTSFWAGRKPWHEVFGDEYANTVKAKLASRGVHLKAGDEYMPELARFQGDPEAVVPFGEGRDYIRRLCEQRGWTCEGAVEVDGREPEADPHDAATPMGQDLIRQKAKLLLQQNPELKRLPRRELREKVLEKFGPSKIAPKKELI